MAAEERLNLPCSGLLALLPLCTDCSEDLQAIRSDPFFFSEVFRTAAEILFWNVLERRFFQSSKAEIFRSWIWDLYHLKKKHEKNHEKNGEMFVVRPQKKTRDFAPGPNVKMLIDLSLGEIYGPSVMGEAATGVHHDMIWLHWKLESKG